jgi:hypothetical protein
MDSKTPAQNGSIEGRAMPIALLFGLSLLLTGAAHAQDDVAPGAKREGVVHVNAIKDPEMHSYRAIAAGLDTFDDQHALAPAAPQLRFSVRARGGADLASNMPTAKLSGDAFSLPLPVGGDALFEVPRSQQAWDTNAELVLSRKRKDVQVWPHVRTPGLADNQRRLGDLRLECQVLIAIVKKEAPFWGVAMINTVLMTGDWCSFFKDGDHAWSVDVDAPLAAAVLRDGERTLALRVKGRHFELPLYDSNWSNDALVDLAYEPAKPKGTAP